MTPEEIVRAFIHEVRAGRNPDAAHTYMAESVLAHQINAENPVTIPRTPADYADHIREFKAAFGDFELEVTELLAQGDKVYVRWIQRGLHIGEYDGFPPTHKLIVEFASAVYRVETGKIAEYWIQVDRAGIAAQLRANQGA